MHTALPVKSGYWEIPIANTQDKPVSLTRALSQTLSFSGRISVGKWNDVSHLILMTDGVSDPLFETDNGLRSDEKMDPSR